MSPIKCFILWVALIMVSLHSNQSVTNKLIFFRLHKSLSQETEIIKVFFSFCVNVFAKKSVSILAQWSLISLFDYIRANSVFLQNSFTSFSSGSWYVFEILSGDIKLRIFLFSSSYTGFIGNQSLRHRFICCFMKKCNSRHQKWMLREMTYM